MFNHRPDAPLEREAISPVAIDIFRVHRVPDILLQGSRGSLQVVLSLTFKKLSSLAALQPCPVAHDELARECRLTPSDSRNFGGLMTEIVVVP